MVDVKQAVRSATSFVSELYGDASDIRLEEVEASEKNWSVVVSFKTGDQTGLNYVLGKDNRLFKTVAVDLENGTPLSLKVWRQ